MDNNNYVQIRFESNKKDRAIGMLKHNMRTLKPSYLRDNMAHNVEDNSIIFDNKIIDLNDYIKRDYYFNMKYRLELLEKDLKENNRNYREKKHALTIDSIITLSNSINTKYENKEITKQEIDNLFLKSIQKLENELNIKAIYGVIHYDEKTPHCHITWENYYKDTKTDKYKGISTQLKKSYSKAQDIVGSVFSEIGFSRGVKGSKTKHLTVQEMHQKEKEIQLQEQQEKIRLEQERLKQQEKENQDKKDILEQFMKDMEKEIKKDFEIKRNIVKDKIKTIEKYKNINDIVKNLKPSESLFSNKIYYEITQEDLNRINKYIQYTNKSIKELKLQTIENRDLSLNLNNQRHKLQDQEIKLEYEKEKINNVKQEYIQYKDFYSKYKDIASNYKSLEKENQELKRELENKDNTINNLYNSIDNKNKKIKELNNVIYKLNPDYYNDIKR